MLTYKQSSIAGLILLISLFGPAQQDTSTLKQLVGTAEKEWVYERFEQYMGDKNRCKKGVSWRFHRDGKLTIKKCQGERTVTEAKQWVIERLSELDVLLKVDNKEFLILFGPALARGNRKEKMILRTRGGSKVEPTKDLVFYHEVD
jgi:hypothetical protein